MVVILVLLLGLGGATWMVFSPPHTLGGRAFSSLVKSVASVAHAGEPAGDDGERDDGERGRGMRDRIMRILGTAFSAARNGAGGSCR